MPRDGLQDDRQVLGGLGKHAAKLGVIPGLKITAINDASVTDHDAFMAALDALRPGDTVFMTVNGVRQSFIAGQNPTDQNKAWIGLQFDTEQGPTPAAVASYGNTGYAAIMGSITLLIFIYALSLGIGLFNLLPLGPVDGGRMFQLAAERILGDKRGHQVWKYLGFFFLGLIIVNLTIGFVR